MKRIAIAGLGHETNSFSPGRTPFAQFRDAGEMPAMQMGPPLVDALRPLNFGIGGFIAAMEANHVLVPLVWAQSGAGPPVEDSAFEWFAERMVSGLRAASGVDGVYLDLHGAMVTESFDDAEGELLARLRAAVGPDIPIVASMDYHGNLTSRMLDALDGIAAYRTYPHTDREETGRRAAAMLEDVFRRGQPNSKRLHRAPFLIPLPFESTDRDPSAALVAAVSIKPSPDVLALEYVPGFPASDIFDAGPAVVAIGYDDATVTAAADAVYARLLAAETDFAEPVWSATEAVAEAMRVAAGASRPVILADTQDNPGGGGSGDTTDLLKALVASGATNAAVAIMIDAAAAAAAHRSGEGVRIELALGGRNGPPGVTPFEATFEILRLADGRFRTAGRTVGGRDIDLGPSALLRVGGVDIVVASRPMQAYDPMVFGHLGVDPFRYAVLALKSSVHFRADFAPRAEGVLLVRAPGWHVLDLAAYPYRKLRPGVRLGPGGPVFLPAGHVR